MVILSFLNEQHEEIFTNFAHKNNIEQDCVDYIKNFPKQTRKTAVIRYAFLDRSNLSAINRDKSFKNLKWHILINDRKELAMLFLKIRNKNLVFKVTKKALINRELRNENVKLKEEIKSLKKQLQEDYCKKAI